MLNIYSSIALCSGLMECQWTTSMYTCAIYQFHFKFHLSVMQIILLKWSIWTVRNGKIFKQVGPSVGACKAQFKYEPDIVINCMKSRCLSEINIRVNLHFYGHPHFIFININIQLDYKGAHIVCIATTIHQEVLHFWNCVNFSLC